MKKIEGKRDDLCVVPGCKNRREQDNWRCERHSIQYYGGQRAVSGSHDGHSRKLSVNSECMAGDYGG